MLAFRPYVNNTIYLNDAIAGIVVGIVAAIGVCALVTGIALFVFRALSVFKIARRRGISNAWLAWVPVCSDWILGSVADQYQYVVKGRIKNRRLPLLLLGIGVGILQIIASVSGINSMVLALRMMMGEIPNGAMAPLILAYVLPVILWIGTVAQLVIHSIAVYDLYSSCNPQCNVLYLVLGLLFQFLEPFFFFVCRNQEEGMPPRREPQPVNPEPVVYDAEPAEAEDNGEV